MFCGDRLADPVAEGLDALVAEELAVDLEQVGPLVGPVLDVLAAADELVDQFVALGALGRGVGEEGARRLGGRRQAGQVEVDAADELGVGAQRRRAGSSSAAASRRPARRCSCARGCGAQAKPVRSPIT